MRGGQCLHWYSSLIFRAHAILWTSITFIDRWQNLYLTAMHKYREMHHEALQDMNINQNLLTLAHRMLGTLWPGPQLACCNSRRSSFRFSLWVKMTRHSDPALSARASGVRGLNMNMLIYLIAGFLLVTLTLCILRGRNRFSSYK